MSRRCQCSRKCQHWAPGSAALLTDERLTALEAVMGVLVDAADAFDSDSLYFDPACRVHGTRPEPHVECSCEGQRTTALEFIAALAIDVRSAVRASGRHEPAGRPGRRAAAQRREEMSLSLAG